MFDIPRVNVIRSDEGFSVEVLDRTGLLYTEGSKSVGIDSEVLVGPSGLVIYTDSISAWNPPHDHETIDGSKRDAIVENIRRAFRHRELEIETLQRT
jgi:hypothetical protein